MSDVTINDIVALCKRRGFIFTGSEIYGGLGGAYDYGPYGVELMRNIRNAWWNAMIYSRDDIEGLEIAAELLRLEDGDYVEEPEVVAAVHRRGNGIDVQFLAQRGYLL